MDPAGERAAFEELVLETAYRPRSPGVLLAELEGQLRYQPEQRRDGLEALAEALALVFSAGVEEGLPALAGAARENPEQPLCQYYLLAARLQAGDASGAREALAGLARADPDDPMVEQLGLHLEGRPIPGISEERRLGNLARFAATPLLRNPYHLAVGSIFEAIRERERARVLDIGVGGGAQMSELLGLLGREDHRVRRLEVVGLDFVDEFLAAAGERLAAGAAELAGRVEVVYTPVRGQVEALDDEAVERITAGGPLDAVNATIALHEVPGEAKLAALRAIRRLAPRRFALAEWNYCLENVLPETSVEFLLNIRRATTGMVAALRERLPLGEARAVAGDWMSMAGGQLTGPAAGRQECFLDATTWRALLERCGFAVTAPGEALLGYAQDAAAVRVEGWYVATSRYAGAAPIALIEASAA